MRYASSSLCRRQFLYASTAMAGGSVISTDSVSRSSETAPSNDEISGKGRIYKSVKWGMILTDGSVLDKFRLLKDLGYDGMELVSPMDCSADEILQASKETGMPVHGLVNSRQWNVRLSSPDPKEREQAVEILRKCLTDAKAFGGSSVLLVPGQVNGADENHDHVWERSIAGIRQVLPLASKLGVSILVENVWNGFCETPEQFRDYLDEINSPWVGAYFDIGNCRKFGNSEDWVKILGSRIVKLDCKDWGDTEGFCKIGDGDVNWPAVRTALSDIKFTGWSTAEVTGGGKDELADIARRMDRFLIS